MKNLVLLNNDNQDYLKNLYFNIGKNQYAISLSHVEEVIKLPMLDYPSKLPSNIVGLLKFGDTVIRVVDIRFYLGLKPSSYSISNRLIIVKTEKSMLGLIVDRVEDVVDVQNIQLQDSNFSNDNSIIDLIFNVENTQVAFINLNSLEKILDEGIELEEVDVQALLPSDENSLEIMKKRVENLDNRFTSTIETVIDMPKFILFSLDNMKYCMPVEFVKEVTKRKNMTPLPGTPDYIEGIMTLKGDFFTIFNLKKILNLKNTEYKDKTNVIIVNYEDFKLGLLVEDIFSIIEVPENFIHNKKTLQGISYISSEIIEENDVKMILDVQKILSDENLLIKEDF